MKITVGQLKQLIREQVEEMARRKAEPEAPYAGAFSDEMMIANLAQGRGDVPAGEDQEFVAEEWDDWVKTERNISDLKAALKSKYNKKGDTLAKALKRAKKAFYEKASYDPDFSGLYLNVARLLPEYQKFFETRYY